VVEFAAEASGALTSCSDDVVGGKYSSPPLLSGGAFPREPPKPSPTVRRVSLEVLGGNNGVG
jgi:hypothetical protein